MLKIKVTNNSYEIYKEGVLKEKGEIIGNDFVVKELHCNSLQEVQEIDEFKRNAKRGNIRYESLLPFTVKYKNFVAYTDGYEYEIIEKNDKYLTEKGVISLVGTVLIPKLRNRITNSEEDILREISRKLVDYLKQNIDIKLNAYQERLQTINHKEVRQ
jgi:hypothetical protein